MSDALDRARRGFADAGRYDRARPDYPQDAVGRLCRECGIGPGARVVDLAAGTGKLTRRLVAAGADVVAVEPSADMRGTLASRLPGVSVLDGTAEAIPLPQAAADAVTVAQAFHWFDGRAAVAEISRVLRPAGAVGLVWNVMDRSVAWVDRLQAVMHTRRGANPWYHDHAWRSAFDASDRFTSLHHASFTNRQVVDIAGLEERIASVSFVADMPEQAREDLFATVRAIVADAGLAPGSIVIPYRTDLFWCRRADTLTA